MKIEQVKEIANAVLYEGYLLYPYRHSSIKNRQRWTIGVLYPQAYSEANGGIEPWSMRTECLLTGQETHAISLAIHVRFLHLLRRTSTQTTTGQAQDEAFPIYEWSLASRMAQEPYEEGIEREVALVGCSLHDLLAESRSIEINFPGQLLEDKAPDSAGSTTVREQMPITGRVALAATQVGENLYKLIVRIENLTPATAELVSRQNAVLLQSFVSTHTILRVRQSEFISLLDPPAAYQSGVQSCQNTGTYPVLVGNEGETDTVLSSPIILYDYPQIAPESPGSLFDGTEIDEILTLRILTLTDEEKEQMRQGDERARAILERTEALTPEQLMKLHGTIRSLRPLDEDEI